MRVRLLLPCLLLLGSTLAAAAEVETISPSVAGLYIGQEKIVEGKVTSTVREANIVKLHFGEKQPRLTVSLVIGLLSRFPPEPETYYLNRMVRVAGTIDEFRGNVEMIIDDPQAVYALDAPPYPGAAPAGAPPSDLQKRYDALSERVHELEQRLKQLEPGSSSPTPTSQPNGDSR